LIALEEKLQEKSGNNNSIYEVTAQYLGCVFNF